MVKLLYLIILLFFSACNSGQSEKNDQPEGKLIFHSGFEPDSKVIIRTNIDADIIGADKNFDDFNPLKLYTSKELIDFMHRRGKTLQLFWDDYSLWKDRRP